MSSDLTVYHQWTEHWGIALSLQRPNDRASDDMIVFGIGCVRPVDRLLKDE